MNVEDQFILEHLFLSMRICRTCGKEKDLLNDFYMIRKDRGKYPSSYSYECKSCTIQRIKLKRKNNNKNTTWEYPDW